MKHTTNTFAPDYAVPPGDTLRETMKKLGLTRKELAYRMVCSVETVNEFIKGGLPITKDNAVLLENATGVPSSFWNNAEANYRARLAKLKH